MDYSLNGIFFPTKQRVVFLAFSFSGFLPLKEHRQERDKDDERHHPMKMFVDIRDAAAQKIADRCHQQNPKNAADHVEGKETAVAHPPHTGDRRRKRADDRNKSRQNNGLAAVFFKKIMRTLNVVLLEKERVFAIEKPGANEITDGIARAVSENSGSHEQRVQKKYVELPLRGYETGSYQK